jgi:rod shape-determining protein MreD
MIFITYLIIFSSFYNQSASLLAAFLLGGMKDIWEGELLGVTSLAYVGIAFAIQLYKRKFNAQSPWFLILSIITATSISEMVERRSVLTLEQAGTIFMVSVISVLVWFIILKLWGTSREKHLSV